jgi:hypothetical protein
MSFWAKCKGKVGIKGKIMVFIVFSPVKHSTFLSDWKKKEGCRHGQNTMSVQKL